MVSALSMRRRGLLVWAPLFLGFYTCGGPCFSLNVMSLREVIAVGFFRMQFSMAVQLEDLHSPYWTPSGQAFHVTCQAEELPGKPVTHCAWAKPV